MPEIKNARKRVSAHRSYLDTQPFSAWPTDKVEDIALAVDCSNSRAMLDWLNTLEKVLGMDDEAEALGEAKDAKPQSLY